MVKVLQVILKTMMTVSRVGTMKGTQDLLRSGQTPLFAPVTECAKEIRATVMRGIPESTAHNVCALVDAAREVCMRYYVYLRI